MKTAPPQHVSVLLQEAVEALALKPHGTYLDATFGRGGHARAILAELNTQGRLYALDRDPTAIEAALPLATDSRFTIVHTPFSQLAQVISDHSLSEQLDGILFDLGVSSPQLDDAERGFSFMRDGPLDMRMDTSSGMTAAEFVNTAPEADIAFVLKEYGEERFARKIARAIVHDRDEKPFLRTRQLAEMIARVVPFKDKHKHPATRAFQGIRIHINGELDEIEQALEAALAGLKTGGRLVVISFHSLEDRLVKRFMRKHSQAKSVPAGMPIKDEELNKSKQLKLLSRAVKPTDGEVSANPRSRSSVLRIAERVRYDDN
ncbi:16S rRNA (cytosine1402-N4)-methyltransferase [Pseudidiomarina planktonica]|uniref:Ribosomal RNA small subunit methyltransferase H n=1 Tax=Pseudidiomarina planktonica TaxID=1323738 RepID=A0A1Y6EDR8_9GAMM|nr:16S rRNA (cytosine(1402)-N(4))-methyltransferase RsmH [Pseudidiomarina planktonica]RUO66068.1 16S rRNA (cytosine(1402)-N(4))-methyltransferase RsmH [Pseudidiomarina planktonica]SMQ60705.1 16S rRNA (cytosine1402-N4)-methyltransferase [Pseudidiomarina planktonica]